MKNFILALVAVVFLSGCNNLNRFLHKDDESSSKETILVGGDPLDETAPEFNVATPEGFRKIVYYDYLGADGLIQIEAHPGSILYVYFKDAGFWFRLGDFEIPAYWYQKINDSLIKIEGSNLNRFPHQYCVYQFVPEVQP